jgi:adenylate kinase family enzyme
VSSQVRTQLPRDARRIVIRGSSGSGKTTMATRIAEVRDIPHVELDSIFHQPSWTALADDEFRARVAAFMDDGSWVVCGNYSVVAPLLLDRVDTLVLFDLPKHTVMARVIWRTLRRGVQRKELWNGNRERLTSMFRRDPERSIVAWTWTNHARYHDTMASLVENPPNDRVRVVAIRSTDDERLFYAGLCAVAAAPEHHGA